jgi:hypothetical protein
MRKIFSLIEWEISARSQILWKKISLYEKLSFSSLYLNSFVYSLARMNNSRSKSLSRLIASDLINWWFCENVFFWMIFFWITEVCDLNEKSECSLNERWCSLNRKCLLNLSWLYENSLNETDVEKNDFLSLFKKMISLMRSVFLIVLIWEIPDLIDIFEIEQVKKIVADSVIETMLRIELFWLIQVQIEMMMTMKMRMRVRWLFFLLFFFFWMINIRQLFFLWNDRFFHSESFSCCWVSNRFSWFRSWLCLSEVVLRIAIEICLNQILYCVENKWFWHDTSSYLFFRSFDEIFFLKCLMQKFCNDNLFVF